MSWSYPVKFLHFTEPAYEAEYIGAAASIAFLQTVRHIVAQAIGPSEFSHDKIKDNVEGFGLPRSTEDVGDITVEQKMGFLRTYLLVVRVSPVTDFKRPVIDKCRPKPWSICLIRQSLRTVSARAARVLYAARGRKILGHKDPPLQANNLISCDESV
jgi:hypothetical protein